MSNDRRYILFYEHMGYSAPTPIDKDKEMIMSLCERATISHVTSDIILVDTDTSISKGTEGYENILADQVVYIDNGLAYPTKGHLHICNGGILYKTGLDQGIIDDKDVKCQYKGIYNKYTKELKFPKKGNFDVYI